MKTIHILSFLAFLLTLSCATSNAYLSKQSAAYLSLSEDMVVTSDLQKGSSSLSWNVVTQSGDCYTCTSTEFGSEVSCTNINCSSKQQEQIAKRKQKSNVEKEAVITSNKGNTNVELTAQNASSVQTKEKPIDHEPIKDEMERRAAETRQQHKQKQDSLANVQQRQLEAMLLEEKRMREKERLDRIASEKKAQQEAQRKQEEELRPLERESEQKEVETNAQVHVAQKPSKEATQPLSSYFIQLASLSSSSFNLGEFDQARSFGTLYQFKEHGTTKIRIGIFQDEMIARDVLEQVRRNGYQDAFLSTVDLSATEYTLLD